MAALYMQTARREGAPVCAALSGTVLREGWATLALLKYCQGVGEITTPGARRIASVSICLGRCHHSLLAVWSHVWYLFQVLSLRVILVVGERLVTW